MQGLAASLSNRSFEIIAILTVFSLVLYGSEEWTLVRPGAVLLTLAILFRRLLTSYIYWLFITTIAIFTMGMFWGSEGDGLTLLIYWSLAILLAITTSERDKHLAMMARLLIGCMFLVALLSKLLSPDFLSGAFYEYFLLRDIERIAVVGVLFTELSFNDVLVNLDAIQALPEEPATLITAPKIKVLANVLTVLTLTFEAAVALSFLLRVPWWIRDGSLVLFLLGTYLVAPIVIFGVTLSIMGFAQTERRIVKVAYFLLLLFIQLTPLRTHVPFLFYNL